MGRLGGKSTVLAILALMSADDQAHITFSFIASRDLKLFIVNHF